MDVILESVHKNKDLSLWSLSNTNSVTLSLLFSLGEMTSYYMYYRVIAFSVKSLSGEIWYNLVMNKLKINTLDFQKSKARGPWATSLTWETKFNSINRFEKSYDYIITLIRKEKKPINILFLRIKWSLFIKPPVTLILGCFVLSLVEIGPVVLETIFTFSQCIFAIS